MEAYKNAEEQAIRIEQAKTVLRNAGYFVDSLWSVADVQSRLDCDTEDATEVLNSALTNEATMEHIWFAIKLHGEEEGFTSKTNRDEDTF